MGLTLLLLRMNTFPSASVISVVRIPISVTVPLAMLPMLTLSPTRTEPSSIIKKPASRSEAMLWAPMPTAMEMMPAEATRAVVLTPKMLRIRKRRKREAA